MRRQTTQMETFPVLFFGLCWLILALVRNLLTFQLLNGIEPLRPREKRHPSTRQQQQIKKLIPLCLAMSLTTCFCLPLLLYTLEVSQKELSFHLAIPSGFLVLICHFAAPIKLAFAGFLDIMDMLEFDVGQAEILRVGCSWSWIFGTGFAYIFTYKYCGFQFINNSYSCVDSEDNMVLGWFDAFFVIVLSSFTIYGIRSRQTDANNYPCIAAENRDTRPLPDMQLGFSRSMMIQLSLSLSYHCLFVFNMSIMRDNAPLAMARSLVHTCHCGLMMHFYVTEMRTILTHMKTNYWLHRTVSTNSLMSMKTNPLLSPMSSRASSNHSRALSVLSQQPSVSRRASVISNTGENLMTNSLRQRTQHLLKGSFYGDKKGSEDPSQSLPWSVDSSIKQNDQSTLPKAMTMGWLSPHLPGQMSACSSVNSSLSSIHGTEFGNTLHVPGVGSKRRLPQVQSIPLVHVEMYDSKSKSMEELTNYSGSMLSFNEPLRSPTSMSESSIAISSKESSGRFMFNAGTPEPLGDIVPFRRQSLDKPDSHRKQR